MPSFHLQFPYAMSRSTSESVPTFNLNETEKNIHSGAAPLIELPSRRFCANPFAASQQTPWRGNMIVMMCTHTHTYRILNLSQTKGHIKWYPLTLLLHMQGWYPWLSHEWVCKHTSRRTSELRLRLQESQTGVKNLEGAVPCGIRLCGLPGRQGGRPKSTEAKKVSV